MGYAMNSYNYLLHKSETKLDFLELGNGLSILKNEITTFVEQQT